VVCVARTQSELDETIAGLDGALALTIDISADDAGQSLMGAALTHLQGLDLLVQSAGIFRSGSIEQTSLSEFDALHRINVRAPFALARAALPALSATRGQMVFINSSIIRAANIAGRVPYAANHAALKAIADGLRDEVNAAGIRVLSVMPGATATPRQAAISAAGGQIYRPERLLQPDDVADAVCAALLLPRTAEVTDIFLRPMLKGQVEQPRDQIPPSIADTVQSGERSVSAASERPENDHA
jgi:NADP-dependent 3-hydroxy acid dehydrogenase YdfG